MHDISCILISNSDDFVFLYKTLEQTHDIFTNIQISIGTKYWNEEDENTNKIEKFIYYVKQNYTNVFINLYKVPEDLYEPMLKKVNKQMYWEGHARYIGYKNLTKETNYVLFLDADEVIDRNLFLQFLNSHTYKSYDCLKLKNYWYWRSPIYRAKDYFEDSVVLIKYSNINPINLFSNLGRHELYMVCNTPKKERNFTHNNDIFIHHFSWVRSKETMLKKVRNWGHRDDNKDWSKLVEHEFNTDFSGTDFIKGLTYDTVKNIFQIEIKDI